MLPANHRIRENSVFQQVFRDGARIAGAYVVVHLASSENSEQAKVGFVVSKRIGNAVMRNRVKRRLRVIAKDFINMLSPGDLLVIRALPRATKASFSALTNDVVKTVQKGLK